MNGQEAYEVWRAAVPDFVCNVPGGPWDELSKAVRAGFDAIAAQWPQDAPAVLERKLAITLNALQRIDRTRHSVVDQGSLWDIAQQAIDQVREVDGKLMTGSVDPDCTVCAQVGGPHGVPQPAPGPPECLASHCPPPGRECDYPECAPTADDLAKWAAGHGAPCPGCESLRRQCSELTGEVGGLAGALTDIRDANPHAPAGGYATERARVALNLLHERHGLEP